jgi:cell division protein FtsB
MKTAILGTIVGLALGSVGALAYSHYLGDGKLLADLQAQLDTANANLAKIAADKTQLTQETTGVSSQVDQLQAENSDLKKQVQDLKSGSLSAEATAASADQQQQNLAALARMMMGAFRGGNNNPQQRMLLLRTRLKLTPDQEAQIRAAMDADNQKRRDLMQQFRNNGKIDPQAAAAANSLDQTMNAILSPEQQTAYKQVQADEQAARANTMATMQVNQIAPLLQLNDAQKDQIFNSLYQVSSSAPDPATFFTNPNAASAFASQAQAMQTAMTKALTPDQLALYQQQLAITPQFGRRPNGGNGGNAGGGAVTTTANGATVTGYVSANAPAMTAATTQVVNPPAAPAATSDTSNAASATNAPTADGSTNTPSATTNAAPVQ